MPDNFDSEKIKEEIRQIIVKIAEIPEKKITDKARFVEDLGMDSMMALEFVASIEKKYKISVPEGEIPKIQSLQDIYGILKGKLKG